MALSCSSSNLRLRRLSSLPSWFGALAWVAVAALWCRPAWSLRSPLLPPKFLRSKIFSFVPRSPYVLSLAKGAGRGLATVELCASPKRLEENVDGMLYVNDRCINCAACSNFAPKTFQRSVTTSSHTVYNQPNPADLEDARAALAACPVAAIRVENDFLTQKDRRLKEGLAIRPTSEHGMPFPRPLFPITTTAGEKVDLGVYYLGHHNDASFGAIPYLVVGKSYNNPTNGSNGNIGGDTITVMVDVPRFSPSAVRALKKLLPNKEPDYLFLTHVDDTAHHNKWIEEYPNLKRIFHSGDLGVHNWIGDKTLENVEVLLRSDTGDHDSSGQLSVWDLSGNKQTLKTLEEIKEGEFRIIHTPGHSPGSISLLFRPPSQDQSASLVSPSGTKMSYPRGVLFTGDTYSWTTRDGGHMTGFPRYGNSLPQQAETLGHLGKLTHLWDIVAPGHGHPRFYSDIGENGDDKVKLNEMDVAIEELLSLRR